LEIQTTNQKIKRVVGKISPPSKRSVAKEVEITRKTKCNIKIQEKSRKI
jgi:hypothetical protein